ncbi:D-glycero-beta-D-manno-heptose 1-phosphate adenylyltransferase [Parachitinimonas caeni]|uniref:D-glycero-beta-D-manno-heptose 1-phosphate adenylyltransferase n=1 Tax=Parachitinimonas caeni TaxID=3031301 RepID=A0ABT7E1D4_9NEIS|nr:D-glycero-beta-D-manno-heptose 1-phosphate adenylyltransferase [Parachitinimonas caeni]MDK2126122.1 D-glycero-beta-D-manno-heptose 1-phosphate adenylyltransferase [Parachitinimonas caeni]
MDYLKPDFESKLCPPELLAQKVAQLPQPIVFTNGCFDILHRGHVSYLAQAKTLGKSLIVAVNTDASVRRLGKGDDRPINSTENRAAVMAALASVDLVTWFDQDTPLELILTIKPQILVKGGDWKVQDIVGSAEVIAWGGKVHSIPFLFNTSTTATIKKIRS